MKVLLLTHHFFPMIGGIESYALGLAKALKANGIECNVACLNRNPGNESKLAESEIIDGIPVKRLAFIDLGFYKIAFGLLGEIKKADLVHVQNIGFLCDFAIATKWIHKKPVVVSTHGGISHTKRRQLPKRLYSKWLGFALKRADFVIADSRQDLAEFEKKSKKIRLIENGVELEKFFSLKKNPIAGSIVFVGRMSKNKRIDSLISAFALAARQKPGASLKIIGKDFDKILPELKRECNELGISGKVSFLENASDSELLDSLAHSEFFATASEFEGFGISVVEAMACGCIPILNDIVAFRAFVDNGKNGFLADFSDKEKAAQKIIAAMNLPAGEKSRLANAAIESVRKFDWKNVIKEIIKAYEGVLE